MAKGIVDKLEMDPTLTSLIQDVKDAKEDLKEYKEDLQATCLHTEVFECGYKPGLEVGGAWPPRRQCVNCLLEEDGWGSGYQELDNPEYVYPIGRQAMINRRY